MRSISQHMTENITAVSVWHSEFETYAIYHKKTIRIGYCACVCSVSLCEIANIKTKISPICWSFKKCCDLYIFLNFRYDNHTTWRQFFSSRESHSSTVHVPEIQQLCYTSPKCLWTLLKLIKSLACLLREIEPNPVWLIISPALTSHMAKYHVVSRSLIPMFLLCPTDNLMVLERRTSERYKEVPADLFGLWKKRMLFFFFWLQHSFRSCPMHPYRNI